MQKILENKNGKRKNFSKRVKKLAREVAKGKCAISSCETTRGEFAHIYPASIDGPRGDCYVLDEYRVDQLNALFLCRNHHDIIDEEVGLYTPTYLNELSVTMRLSYVLSHNSNCLKSYAGYLTLYCYSSQAFYHLTWLRELLEFAPDSNGPEGAEERREWISKVRTHFHEFNASFYYAIKKADSCCVDYLDAKLDFILAHSNVRALFDSQDGFFSEMEGNGGYCRRVGCLHRADNIEFIRKVNSIRRNAGYIFAMVRVFDRLHCYVSRRKHWQMLACLWGGVIPMKSPIEYKYLIDNE